MIEHRLTMTDGSSYLYDGKAYGFLIEGLVKLKPDNVTIDQNGNIEMPPEVADRALALGASRAVQRDKARGNV